MPAGLVVNELLTNSLKHAFKGRDHGTISLTSVVGPSGCRVCVADDGVGLEPGQQWPRPGKMALNADSVGSRMLGCGDSRRPPIAQRTHVRRGSTAELQSLRQ